MKKKSFKVLVLGLLLATLLPVSVLAADDTSVQFAGNFFEAGNIATVSSVKAKDVFAAGNRVVVSSSDVTGNIFAAGNNVEVSGSDAKADIVAAGQIVTVKSDNVDGNIIAAGQMISVYDSECASVIAAAASVNYENSIADEVVLSGQVITFNGTVNGDVKISGDDVVIGENAVIKGTLTVNSAKEAEISDAASVAHYKYNQVDNESLDKAKQVSVFANLVSDIVSRAYWIPAMALIGLILSLVFAKQLDDAKELIRKKPVKMVVTGVLTWMLTPVAIILALVTIIGAPLAAILGIVYVFMLLLGLAFAGASLGRMVFPKLNPILASVIGVSILQLVRIIPVVGTIVAVVADMYLLGYVGLAIAGNIPVKEKKAIVYAQALEEPPVMQSEEVIENAENSSGEVKED